MELKKLGEFGLIDRIARLASRKHPSIIQGIGDDAAVLRLTEKESLLITTDLLTEGIHFETSSTTPYLLGKKSVAANLSDIAAMGGTPLYYVVSLSIPPRTPYEFIQKLYQGMRAQAQQYGAALVGGDTTASAAPITISIALMGTARTGTVLYRHGARRGDAVYATGFLGDAALGLLMIQKGKALSGRNRLIRRHLDPVPRVEEGKAISRLRLASSMIDISDGLVADLRHILEQSHAGATLRLSRLPLSAPYKKLCKTFSDDFYVPALCGGEDYELLFTVPPRKRHAVETWARTLTIPITHIGEITGNSGKLKILDDRDREVAISKRGFTHF
ncbi:MAG: thiamine-phosphate kinase [Proteobacteria bacterium]|nr:thiamine-phosphate kinase [Pseudomonadota bacterium]